MGELNQMTNRLGRGMIRALAFERSTFLLDVGTSLRKGRREQILVKDPNSIDL
jgi:hypothetical protein